MCIGESVLDVSVASRSGHASGDQENLSDQSFTCSETSAAPVIPQQLQPHAGGALGGSALFGAVGRNKKNWKKRGRTVTKEQLDEELDYYMNQSQKKAQA